MNANNVYLCFLVEAFKLSRTDNWLDGGVSRMKLEDKDPPSGIRNYLHAKFQFSTDWLGVACFAIFSRDSTVIRVPILGGTCQVPNEMTEEPGIFTVSVYAGDRKTTNSITIKVFKSGYKADAVAPLPPTEPGAIPVLSVNDKVQYIRENGGVFEYSLDGAEWRQIATASTEQPGGGAGLPGPQGERGEPGPQGLPGVDGEDGREIELQNNGEFIQWRYAGDSAWNNLIALSDLTGGIGTTDHTKLSSLGYNESGHVGFASRSDIEAIQSGVSLIDLRLQQHSADPAKHVTTVERDFWNSKVDSTDSRLSDSRPPIAHTHNPVDIAAGLIVSGSNTTVERDPASGAYKINAQSGGGTGGGISEEQAISAVERGQPNFVEENATAAVFGSNLKTTVIAGAGWLEYTKTFRHEPGYTENLSYPIEIKQGSIYEITFTCGAAKPDDGITIIFAASPADTIGQTIKSKIHYDATFVAQATGNYSYINIIPHVNWANHTSDPVGTFNLDAVKEATALNSESVSIKGMPEIVRQSNYVVGGGGRVITSTHNIGIGENALRYNTTGGLNVAVGKEALNRNASGDQNIAIGDWALYYNATGSQNAAVGSSSLNNNVTGNNNAAFGTYALEQNETGSGNAAIGKEALRRNKTGSNNVGCGADTLAYNLAGYRNVAVGCGAGTWLAGGNSAHKAANNSVFIGANIYGSAEDDQTNQIVVGYRATGNGSNSITLGNSDITKLYCQVTAITAISDRRVKEEIEPANLDLCLEAVKNLPVSRYKYKDFTGTHTDKHVTGFLADDVEKVFPKSVSKQNKYFPVLDENGNQVYEVIEDEDGTTREVAKMFLLADVKDITMTEAVPTLWGAMQALINEVDELKTQVKAL